MTQTTYELDVRLRDIEPPIWRVVEVPGSALLEDVHFAIQVAMGWTNSHLHEFRFGGVAYGMVDVDGAEVRGVEDECEFSLEDVAQAGSVFEYQYDFGDGWDHEVTVKRVTTVAKERGPRCIAGARACPPEDCGGPGGYANLLVALADPSHEEHHELREWAGNFKPERFSLPKGGRDVAPQMDELKELMNDEGVVFSVEHTALSYSDARTGKRLRRLDELEGALEELEGALDETKGALREAQNAQRRAEERAASAEADVERLRRDLAKRGG